MKTRKAGRAALIGVLAVAAGCVAPSPLPQAPSAPPELEPEGDTFAYGVVEDLSGIAARHERGRWFGTDGEREAAEYLAGVMRSLGLSDVRLELFSLPRPEPLEWSLSMDLGQGLSPVEARPLLGTQHLDRALLPSELPLPPRQPPPYPDNVQAADLEVEVVWIPDYADSAAVDRGRGKIHLLHLSREMLRTDPYAYGPLVEGARQAGAVGFLYAHHEPGLRFHSARTIRIPGLSIAFEDFASARDALERGAAVRARLVERHAETVVQSQNVVGEIRGQDPSRVLLVGAHYDSWWTQGAGDNGAGTAVVMALAKRLSEAGTAPAATVRFVAFGGEELGLLGSYAHAAAHADERYVAAFNVDMVAHNTPGSTLSVLARDEATLAVVRSAVEPLRYTDATGYGIAFELGFASDESRFANLTTTAGLSKSPYAFWHLDGGEDHARGDTPDKIDRLDLRWTVDVATAMTAALLGSASTAPPADMHDDAMPGWARSTDRSAMSPS